MVRDIVEVFGNDPVIGNTELESFVSVNENINYSDAGRQYSILEKDELFRNVNLIKSMLGNFLTFERMERDKNNRRVYDTIKNLIN